MKLVSAILIVMLIATRAPAQDSTAHEPLSDRMMQDINLSGTREISGKKIKAELQLTDDQSKQLKNINQDFHTQVKSLRHNSTFTVTQKQEQFSQLQDDHEGRIKTLLNAEQYEKYQQWSAKRQERWKALKKMQDRQLPGKTTPGKS